MINERIYFPPVGGVMRAGERRRSFPARPLYVGEVVLTDDQGREVGRVQVGPFDDPRPTLAAIAAEVGRCE